MGASVRGDALRISDLASLRIPSFATGGIVPGDGPKVILAHGGERVEKAETIRLGAEAATAQKANSINVKTELTVHATGEAHLTRELQQDLEVLLDERDRDLTRMIRQGVD